jgi:YfiH family protein
MTIPLLTSRLLRSGGFAHGFTTRAGGVSPPPYDTLDFAMLRDPERLAENRRRLAESVGFDPSRLYQVTQVHGSTVLDAEGDVAALASREADALVAEPGSGNVVAVRVADCVPVLVADPESGRVAAAHAGWRGVVGGVLEATVERMKRGGAIPSVLLAAIGPCIGSCCFEVGADVAAQIEEAAARGSTWDPRWGQVVARRDEPRGKAYVDLRVAVRRRLHAAGLSFASIEDVPGCTRCDAERFYSFRRDGDASGRLLGVIAAR